MDFGADLLVNGRHDETGNAEDLRLKPYARAGDGAFLVLHLRRLGWSCMNRILVIGATGRIGRQVISQLPTIGLRVRALARNPHTADLPPHA